MNPHAYFERFVLGYQVGDIEYLLKRCETRCGILLAPVLFGIDAVGGSLCGFSDGPNAGSRHRSCVVMTAHMSLAPPQATFVYKSLRCGLLHQGTAKYGLRFFCSYDCEPPEERGVLCRRPGDGWLFLDCVALAARFVAAARRVWTEQRQAIIHVPLADPSGHDLAKTVTATDISRLRERIESSRSAFDPPGEEMIPGAVDIPSSETPTPK